MILAASGEWLETRPERAYTVLCSNYGGVKQRWLVVYTQAAHGRTEQTVNKQHLKQSQAEYKAFNALAKRFFACAADAQAALAQLQKKLKVVALHDPGIVEVEGFKGKRGAPLKAENPIRSAIGLKQASLLCSKHGTTRFNRKAVLFSPAINWRKRNSATKSCLITLRRANKKSNAAFVF